MKNPATQLRQCVPRAAFAFRGYNTTNLGRSAELLAHPRYTAIVEQVLDEASQICRDITSKPIDLAARIRRREETTLASYDEAIALVVAMSLAQIRLLEQCFDIRYADSPLTFGYSLGELTAIIAGGVFPMSEALRVPLVVAEDCVALAEGVTMGVLFSRGPALNLDDVQRLCLSINMQGEGVIGISAYLAPNTCLLMGQGETISRFAERMRDVFHERVYLRKNADQWPPVHTSIVWQRGVPNRAGILMHTLSGGFTPPSPPVLSLVTGECSYDGLNARELLNKWIDHPQRLWDAVEATLTMGLDTVIHVGPDPNLIPATFKRLSENILAQQNENLSLRALSRVVRNPWLAALLPQHASLLRAPLQQHLILEDWLLDHAAD